MVVELVLGLLGAALELVGEDVDAAVGNEHDGERAEQAGDLVDDLLNVGFEVERGEADRQIADERAARFAIAPGDDLADRPHHACSPS